MMWIGQKLASIDGRSEPEQGEEKKLSKFESIIQWGFFAPILLTLFVALGAACVKVIQICINWIT